MKLIKNYLPLTVGALMLTSTSVLAQAIEVGDLGSVGDTSFTLDSNVNTQSLSAGVNGALAGDTGFITGGQVQVNGVGQGSLSLARGQAVIGVESGATSGVGLTGASSSSEMVSTFDFQRDVNTSAALVGIVNVVAQGESVGGIGGVGSSTGTSRLSGVGTRTDYEVTADDGTNVTAVSTTETLSPFNGSSDTVSSGSLVGSLSTQNTIQLVGNGDAFAGSQALDIGERNQAYSFGRTGLLASNNNTIDLADPTVTYSTSDTSAFTTASVTGEGAGFGSNSELTSDVIDINVANAGNGSVLVTGSTGGFFTEGTTFGASGALTRSDAGGFFSGSFLVGITP
jgi:hypothetical protein